MSIFDPPKQERLSDVFPVGVNFWLLAAHYDGIQPTSFGDRTQASVTVSPPNAIQDQKQYRVWGSLAEQIHALEDRDLPAEVCVAKDGRKNVWNLIRILEGLNVQQVQTPTEEEPGF